MADMWVEIKSLPLAEKACHQVFGEDVWRGPELDAPASLLNMLQDWPKPTDEIHRVAVETPADFDIDHQLGKGERKALVLHVQRMTVYSEGKLVGYALRTDELGINALKTYWEMVEAHRRKIRQAH